MPLLRPDPLFMLVCPVPDCRSRLDQQDDRLVCLRCGRRYRIEGDIAILVPEEAETALEKG